MTWIECRQALRQHNKRTYLLAIVAQIHEPVLSKCSVGARPLADRALDVTRRWCIGEATAEECREAGAAAYAAAYADANSGNAAYAAAYASADAADAALAADAYVDASAARALLVESIADAPRAWHDAVVADGNVRTATHVWWREGRFGGRWKRLTNADAVRFDAVLEGLGDRHTPSESTTTTVT